MDIASDSRESNTTVVNPDSGGLRRGSATFIACEHDLHKYRRSLYKVSLFPISSALARLPPKQNSVVFPIAFADFSGFNLVRLLPISS